VVPHSSGEKRILAISAHPDDVEFTSSGSLTRWVSEGWVVSLIVCTDGGQGSHDSTVVPADLAAMRQAEQRTVANVLGIPDSAIPDAKRSWPRAGQRSPR
jgi:LmbE family N-acetylglucosaminyl deacetylase